MLSGEFERKLRILNRKLRIFCADDADKPAGIHVLTPSGWDQIIGCDKNWVSERAEFDEYGHMLRSGWRRVLRILIQKRFVDRRHAERVFLTHLPYAAQKLVPPKRVVKHDMMDRYVTKYLSYDEAKKFEAARK